MPDRRGHRFPRRRRGLGVAAVSWFPGHAPRRHIPQMPADLPLVMTFSAADPTGGAGLQADLLTLASLGAHGATVLTGFTVQDTTGVEEFVALDASHVEDQARTILEDMPVAAFKIGVLGDTETVLIISEILSDYPDLPVILDPVLASGRGDLFADDETLHAMRSLLLPETTILTPNSYEARRLAAVGDGSDGDGDAGSATSLDDAAAALLRCGAEYVLVTGTHENTGEVVNRLYGSVDEDEVRLIRSDSWKRLPGSYHGSGCTLASAIAALIACGASVEDAVRQAQEFTWQTLANGFRPGMGQFIPDRFYWARSEEARRLRGAPGGKS
jgi:hydroxymethylpyrimidine/phosphomethylpyrimidine kinase